MSLEPLAVKRGKQSDDALREMHEKRAKTRRDWESFLAILHTLVVPSAAFHGCDASSDWPDHHLLSQLTLPWRVETATSISWGRNPEPDCF
jgi:hypothetical protein